jgi:hypothetical protein
MGKFDWNDKSRFDSRNQLPRVGDLVEMLELDENWKNIRIVGLPVVHRVHWFKLYSEKKNSIVSLMKPAAGVNPETGEYDAENDPYHTLLGLESKEEYYVNVIDRDIQNDEPKKKRDRTPKEEKQREWNGGSYYLKESKTKGGWTPVRVMRLTPAMARKISELGDLNKVTNKKTGKTTTYMVDHPKYGFDISIKYDKKAKSANEMYSIQKSDRSPLTEEELELLLWKIPDQISETTAVAEKEAKNLMTRICDEEGNLLFAKSDKSSKSKSKKGFADKFDDEDADEDDEDEKPSKSKAKSSKSKSSKFDEDEDEEDEDEDEKPVKKKPSKSKAKVIDDEDDDEDEEDDDEDEVKSSKSSKAKSSKFDDDDEDDEDEDEKPVKKKSSKSKPVDDDEDEDEEDEKPVKKKPSSKSTKLKTKTKIVDDDDEEEDDEDEKPVKKKSSKSRDDWDD